MPRPSSASTTYLEKKDGKWRVTVAVPRDLHKKLGTRLKQSLHTDSLAVANKLKWQVVGELRAAIEHARTTTGKAALTREAIAIAAIRSRAKDASEIAEVEDAITLRADEIAGKPEGVEHIPGVGPVYEYDSDRQRQADDFVALARGDATPRDHNPPRLPAAISDIHFKHAPIAHHFALATRPAPLPSRPPPSKTCGYLQAGHIVQAGMSDHTSSPHRSRLKP